MISFFRHRMFLQYVDNGVLLLKKGFISRLVEGMRIGISQLPWPLCRNESSCEDMFPLRVHFRANQTHFHMKGFARGLVLKPRHKGTRKWPILFTI